MPRRRVRHVLECESGADLRQGDVLRLGCAGWSGQEDADQREDGEGAQRHRHREDHDDPSGPGREGHRLSTGGVGRDDPQELQEHPHTTSSAGAVPA